VQQPLTGLDVDVAATKRVLDGTQRQEELGTLALAMSDVPASDLRRMGRPNDQ
jgi:hypothetical protein